MEQSEDPGKVKKVVLGPMLDNLVSLFSRERIRLLSLCPWPLDVDEWVSPQLGHLASPVTFPQQQCDKPKPYQWAYPPVTFLTQ